MTTIPSMCRHHLAGFSSNFSKSKQSLKCSNPLHIHSVVGCNLSDVHVNPGQKLCTTCIKELVKLKNKEIFKKSNTSESELEDMEEAFANVFSDENEVFSTNETHKVKDAFLQLHEPRIGEDLIFRSKSTIGKFEFYISQQQISIFFCVSEHQVRRSAILKGEKGLLAKLDKKQDRPITEDEKEIVPDFYLCDENSKQLPGMKDYVSVRTREECMLKRCPRYPGTEPPKTLLTNIVANIPVIKFNQWETTDHSMFKNLLKKIDALTRHNLISKEQGKYYSTQSSYFNPASQATIHTYLAILNVAGKISNHSICVISDYMGHNTIIHFTDGSASQYKNFKNFLNLAYHKDDFFRNKLARRASLQNRIDGVVNQTPQLLYDWCSRNVHNIKSFFVSQIDVHRNDKMLEERFKFGKRIQALSLFIHSFPLTKIE
ncbi:hypothetical protein GHT06_017024 [Daphnia sinensis]|uniref:Uncharacterized protein n=1 Tax=Daphnia sinensis TaxID=1820382 RepID=A0AAD5PRW6_9CRUS|nr:hypothetical protein GHT06_017024 [Daphnia sinensis]